LLDDICDHLENHVAAGVSVAVVEALEKVYVKHEHRQRHLLQIADFDFFQQYRVEIVLHLEVGHHVGRRHFKKGRIADRDCREGGDVEDQLFFIVGIGLRSYLFPENQHSIDAVFCLERDDERGLKGDETFYHGICFNVFPDIVDGYAHIVFIQQLDERVRLLDRVFHVVNQLESAIIPVQVKKRRVEILFGINGNAERFHLSHTGIQDGFDKCRKINDGTEAF